MTKEFNLPATLTSTDLFFNPVAFEQLQRAATMFSSSALVPAHMHGRDKIGDCAIALALAHEMRESPIMVMQNIYVVRGKAGWNAQYLIARANKYGVFKGNLRWRFETNGEIEITKVIKDKPNQKVKVPNLSATCFAVLKESGEEASETVDMAMAEAEEWTKNSKYHTLPRLMLQYRAATFLIRLHCPEVMMGLPVIDEVEDTMIARGDLRAGADGTYRVDPSAPSRPTRQAAAASATTRQAVDIEAELTGVSETTRAAAAADTEAQEESEEEGEGSAGSEAIAEADVTLAVANEGAKPADPEPEAETATEGVSAPPIPELKAFALPDSRAVDWARFQRDFAMALNAINPEQVDDMILAHTKQLARMQKEDRIRHVAVMEHVAQRREAKIIS